MQTASARERRIGRYLLLDELGRGAMGIVYRATDPLINRTVAVKLLHVAHLLSPEQAQVVHERFMREAQTAGGLDHPNIVRIFDVGQDEETGQLYLVMEYIAGPSLERVLEEQGLDPGEAIDLIRQIGSALDAAHARAIIHRDIKPANILFTEEGVPKITDFGIARISSSHLTQDVRDLGTPIYMSPEQVLGKPLDGRADLFSLGVLAYRLLTGRVPFEGSDSISVAYNIIHSTPPPVTALAPHLPRELDAVLVRILDKESSGRYTSGFELQEALASALEDAAPAQAPRHRPGTVAAESKRKRIAQIAGALGLVLLAALVVRGLGGSRRQTASVPAERAEEVRPGPDAASPDPAARPMQKTPEPAKPAAVVPSAKRTPAPKEHKAPPPVTAPPPVETAVVTPEHVETAPPVPVPEPPSAPAPVPAAQASLSLSLGHWITRGNVEVRLDGATILSEGFAKKKLVPFQTTSWGAIAVPAGHHRLTATVVGAKGKEYVSEPLDLDLAEGETTTIRMAFKDEALVFKRKE